MRKSTITLFGFALSQICQKTGLAMPTVYRHAKNIRSISKESAKVYHEKLGVAYSVIWPDIFTSKETKKPR